MKHLITAALVFLTAEMYGQDQSERLGNAIAIQTDCSFMEKDKDSYFYKCSEYLDIDMFKTYMNLFFMDKSDIEQIMAWTIIEEGAQGMFILFEEEYYAVVYNENANVFAISHFEN